MQLQSLELLSLLPQFSQDPPLMPGLMQKHFCVLMLSAPFW